jgi:hypothetical protein
MPDLVKEVVDQERATFSVVTHDKKNCTIVYMMGHQIGRLLLTFENDNYPPKMITDAFKTSEMPELEGLQDNHALRGVSIPTEDIKV